MSPKRVITKNTAAPKVTVERSLVDSVADATVVENTEEKAAETSPAEGAGAESTTSPAVDVETAVVDGPPAVKSAPTRTTPAAQAANRARRIGGSAVRPPAESDGNATTESTVKPASLTKPEAKLKTESAKSASATRLDDTVVEPARKRGMTGRPAAKSRVEPAENSTPEAKAKGGFRLGIEAIIALVLAAVAVALAAVNVLVWHPWQHTDKTAQVRGQILSSVNQATALVLSYDYRKWDASATAAEVNLTGQFKTDYSNAMTGSLKGTGISTKTVVVGKVDNSGLVSINSKGTQATVAVYAERSKTNTSNTDPVIDLLAIQVTTDKVNGKWLISKLGYID